MAIFRRKTNEELKAELGMARLAAEKRAKAEKAAQERRAIIQETRQLKANSPGRRRLRAVGRGVVVAGKVVSSIGRDIKTVTTKKKPMIKTKVRKTRRRPVARTIRRRPVARTSPANRAAPREFGIGDMFS